MADPKFWHDLEPQFRELSSPFDLRADWSYPFGSDRVTWHIAPRSSRFENLARRAGAAVSNSADADSLEVWLSLLKGAPSAPYPAIQDKGPPIVFGTVSGICEASANLCMEFETKALEAERRRQLNPMEPARPEAAGEDQQPVAAPTPHKRKPSSITSEIAVRKMEAFLGSHHIKWFAFAKSAKTTDRTLRTFRRTGGVSRDTLDGIAEAMGTKADDLLKPE
jgi:hypothetical protein